MIRFLTIQEFVKFETNFENENLARLVQKTLFFQRKWWVKSSETKILNRWFD